MSHPGWRRLTGATAALTATFALGTITLVAAVPGLVDSGFLGWLEFPLGQRMALHLPLAFFAATVGPVTLGAFGRVRRWWSGAIRVRYAALVLASVVLAAQLAAWHLIGWGLI